MSWWVYKCNSKQHAYQSAWGDCRDFFEGNPDRHWGSTDWVPALAQLQLGDMIIAYQTDRNELVGLAKVQRPRERDGYLYLTPMETIGAGFGSADRNRQVERAAVSFVTRRYTSQGWHVRNVSSDNLGYDIECRRGKNVRHGNVILRSAEGDEFILAEIDDFNREIELTRKNKQLMKLLDLRAKQKARVSLLEAKKQLRIEK